MLDFLLRVIVGFIGISVVLLIFAIIGIHAVLALESFLTGLYWQGIGNAAVSIFMVAVTLAFTEEV